MTWLEIIVLSIIQGVAEFLPISSSGHLFLVEKLMGMGGDLMLYNVVLHSASVVAVIIVMWKDILGILRSFRLVLLLILATIPAVVGGFLIKSSYELFSGSYFWIAAGLWFTSLFVFLIDYFEGNRDYQKMGYLEAVWVGIMQMVALVPGVSRSGSTILGGRIVGLTKQAATKFGFLMSIPVILGATVLEVSDLMGNKGGADIDTTKYVVGFVLCLVVSYVVVKWFTEKIKQIQLKYFAIYTLVLGMVVIAYCFLEK
ncbi:undecaprenyl-diphosphate phosphatase [Patescibacteria group bacterium]|nr:undecaprenyl-diphosphate phosphatase [Patescibacteria group bacterium]